MMEYRVTRDSQAPGDRPDTMVATGQEEMLVKVEDLDSRDYREFPGCLAERGRRGNPSSSQLSGRDFRAIPASQVLLVFREFLAFLDRWAPGVPQEWSARPVGLDLRERQDRRVTMGSVTRGDLETRVIPEFQVYQEVLSVKPDRLSDPATRQEKRVRKGIKELRENSDTQGSRELLVQRERKEKKESWDFQAQGERVVWTDLQVLKETKVSPVSVVSQGLRVEQD